MIVIDDIIISDDLKLQKFVCDLNACKGVCCIEGEGGAPLEIEELKELDEHYDKIKPFITEKGAKIIEEKGKYIFEKDDEYTGYGTPLMDDKGACAYVNFDSKGTAYCGIEKAHNEEKIPFRKPISCHLYPVRIKVYKGFEAVNYEDWEICDAACTLGEQLKIPVYKFCKDALIRKFGEEFYETLETIISNEEDNKGV